MTSVVGKYFAGIPNPAPDLNALFNCVVALKNNLEALTGQRQIGPATLITQQDLTNAGLANSMGFGAWTPVLAGTTTAGTQTYTQQVGYFKKIGNLVFLTARMIVSVKDGATAGNTIIKGFPFTFNNNVPQQALIVAADSVTLDAGFTVFLARGASGASNITFDETGSNKTITAMPSANWNTPTITVTGCVLVN